MDCPHHDLETCEDCPDYPCSLVTRMVDLPMPRTDCTRCPLARIVADFIYRLDAEQAYMTGDMARDEWIGLLRENET